MGELLAEKARVAEEEAALLGKKASDAEEEIKRLRMNVSKVCMLMLYLRRLDIVFQGQYLPSLSVNCVAINKDLEKLTPQLY